MMAGYGGGLGFGMGLGWIFPLVLVGLVVWAIVAATRSRTTGGKEPLADRSLALLRERYAKGELDDQTFQHMRTELEH